MPASRRPLLSLAALVAATLALAACGDSSPTDPVRPPPGELPVLPRVAQILFAQTRLGVQVGERTPVRASALDANGLLVTDRAITYRSSDEQVVRVTTDGAVEALRPGEAMVSATSEGVTGTLPVRVAANVEDGALLGRWRMASLADAPLPASYARFAEQDPGTGVVVQSEIRIDSATMELRVDGRYTRRYYFSEWKNGARHLQYGWGDHGIWRQPRGQLAMESNWIQNLRSDGTVLGEQRLALQEVLWHGEAARRTGWTRTP